MKGYSLSYRRHTGSAVSAGASLVLDPVAALLSQLRMILRSSKGVCAGRVHVLTGQLLQRPALRLRDQQTREDTAKHEQRKDLHDMLEPRRVGRARTSTPVDQRSKHALRDNGPDLTSRSADAVRGRPIPRGEALARNDERGGVGSEVKEELRDHIQPQKTIVRVLQRVIGESNDNEESSQHDETHQLDRLATNPVHRRNSHPVARDGSSTDEDQVAHSVVVEVLVDGRTTGVADRSQNNGVVQTKTVER